MFVYCTWIWFSQTNLQCTNRNFMSLMRDTKKKWDFSEQRGQNWLLFENLGPNGFPPVSPPSPFLMLKLSLTRRHYMLLPALYYMQDVLLPIFIVNKIVCRKQIVGLCMKVWMQYCVMNKSTLTTLLLSITHALTVMLFESEKCFSNSGKMLLMRLVESRLENIYH